MSKKADKAVVVGGWSLKPAVDYTVSHEPCGYFQDGIPPIGPCPQCRDPNPEWTATPKDKS